MSVETVYAAMKEGVWYLPEEIPVELEPETVKIDLRHLVAGLMVIKETKSMEEMGRPVEKNKRRNRLFYQSKQKDLF